MGKRRTAEEIEGLLRQYEERGSLTRQAFCESQNIPLATLGYYLRRKQTKPARLARVRLSTAPDSQSRFALILSGGRRIECELAGLPQLIRAADQA